MPELPLTANSSNRKMQTSYTIRQGKIQDAPVITQLIIQAMTPECCLYFCGREHSIEEFAQMMQQLVERTDTQYSYLNTLCAVDSHDRVIGISVSYDGTLLHSLRQRFIDAVSITFGKQLDGMADETSAGELYLDSLAVHPSAQGRGIATTLLDATAEKARQMSVGPLGLLVDTGNPRAERLYLRCGFRQVGTNRWGGHDMKHLQR